MKARRFRFTDSDTTIDLEQNHLIRRIRLHLPRIPILDERHRVGRFVQLQSAQMDAGELRLLHHVAQRPDVRHKRLQRRPSVPKARYAGLSARLQGNVYQELFIRFGARCNIALISPRFTRRHRYVKIISKILTDLRTFNCSTGRSHSAADSVL